MNDCMVKLCIGDKSTPIIALFLRNNLHHLLFRPLGQQFRPSSTWQGQPCIAERFSQMIEPENRGVDMLLIAGNVPVSLHEIKFA